MFNVGDEVLILESGVLRGAKGTIASCAKIIGEPAYYVEFRISDLPPDMRHIIAGDTSRKLHIRGYRAYHLSLLKKKEIVSHMPRWF